MLRYQVECLFSMTLLRNDPPKRVRTCAAAGSRRCPPAPRVGLAPLVLASGHPDLLLAVCVPVFPYTLAASSSLAWPLVPLSAQLAARSRDDLSGLRDKRLTKA